MLERMELDQSTRESGKSPSTNSIRAADAQGGGRGSLHRVGVLSWCIGTTDSVVVQSPLEAWRSRCLLEVRWKSIKRRPLLKSAKKRFIYFHSLTLSNSIWRSLLLEVAHLTNFRPIELETELRTWRLSLRSTFQLRRQTSSPNFFTKLLPKLTAPNFYAKLLPEQSSHLPVELLHVSAYFYLTNYSRRLSAC